MTPTNPDRPDCLDRTGMSLSRGRLEQILRGSPLSDPFTAENGHILLLCGPPGTGKTTLALHLTRELHRERREKLEGFGDRSALMLSLVETTEQIEKITEIFDLGFPMNEDRPGLRLVLGRYREGEEPDLEGIFRAAGQEPRPGDVLLIDGVSALRSREQTRDHVLAFINQIKELRLTAILVSDLHREGEDRFLEYAVDGILRLGWNSTFRSRQLEIPKWRWRDFFPGPHSFRLLASEEGDERPGVLFFPSIDCLVRLRAEEPPVAPVSTRGVPSGTEGFDALVKQEGGPFLAGDRILLLGPPGVGKASFGTQFLATGRREKGDRDGGRSVALTFAQTHAEFSRRFLWIPEDVRQQMRPCHFLQYDPSNLVPDEVVGALHNLLLECERTNDPQSITRLYVGGISDLRCLFPSDQGFERFLRSFLRLLASFPRVASVVSYEVDRIFASYSELQIPAGDLFTTLIGVNFFEQHNALTRGLVLLKCRGRHHTSSLKVAEITEKGTFRVDLRAGWPFVGLIGGQREQVRQDTLFLKLFYENSMERELIREPFDGFRKRYPDSYVFKRVAKPNPQPTHWSFTGYAGVGHSNTKIVALRKYVMDVLRKRGVLDEVPLDFWKERYRDRFEDSPFWPRDPASEEEARVLVPYYADVGVLVYQRDLLAVLHGEAKPRVPRTWTELLELKKSVSTKSLERIGKVIGKPVRHLFVIPNAAEIKGFVAFFFELCWSHGWRFDPEGPVEDQLRDWVGGEAFARSTVLLRDLVKEPRRGPSVIPNPTVGGHYHRSIFARRWFSKIQLSSTVAEARNDKGRKRFEFGIAELPGISKSRPGISCVDLYAIGILRGSLAPETAWMLASELLSAKVEVERAQRKRGFPISRIQFRSAELQDKLRQAPPGWDPKATEADESRVFGDYARVLGRILRPMEPHKGRFCRTCDIPGFWFLESTLARRLSSLLDERKPASLRTVVARLRKELPDAYQRFLKADTEPEAGGRGGGAARR